MKRQISRSERRGRSQSQSFRGYLDCNEYTWLREAVLRTTLDLNDTLLAEAKALAARECS